MLNECMVFHIGLTLVIYIFTLKKNNINFYIPLFQQFFLEEKHFCPLPVHQDHLK